ncbi:MAG: class I SAM-dependent methyltransferase [Candidatus Eisenbacteria sp.]|nr:class I SAM-dependent methyltransferase [Candidatus Eisenbacteria bacterium]
MKTTSCFEQMRPKEAYAAILEQRERDGNAFYARHHTAFVDVDCPACSQAGVYAFTKYHHEHRYCPECHTLYCSPRPSEELLNNYYNEYDAPQRWTQLLLQADDERKALQYRPRVEGIIAQMRRQGASRGGVAVDVGAGAGTFALCVKETGFFQDVVCIDMSKECVEICRRKGLRSQLGRIVNLDAESADLLTMNDLIEHVFDPASMLRDCHRVLKPGGFVAIATPNGRGFDFLLLKERTRNITPPEHLTYFNPQSLERLLLACGFKTVAMHTPGKLDVAIILKEIEAGFSLSERNEFLHFLFQQEPRTLENFQSFLSDNRLSSHMLCMARRT